MSIQTHETHAKHCAFQSLLADIETTIDDEPVKSPIAIVMDAGHLSLPATHDGITWARDSIAFAELLAHQLIRDCGRRVRVINVLLINDISQRMSGRFRNSYPRVAYSKNRILTSTSINVISEKNLVNRAYRYLRKGLPGIKNKRTRQFSCGGMSVSESARQIPIPIAKKHKSTLVPRCSLINFMLLLQAHKLARERLFVHETVPFIYICFANAEAEYEQVRNGVEVYALTGQHDPFYPFIVHFENSDAVHYSAFRVQQRVWSDEDEEDEGQLR
jgi:hypothetical protein